MKEFIYIINKMQVLFAKKVKKVVV